MLEGSISEDAGAEIRDGVKVVHKYGAPNEKLWPYNIAKFAQKPPATAYTAGLKELVSEYQRVTSTTALIKAALAQAHPIIFGFSVYESFESATVAKTGVVPMPKKGEELLGGHAVLAVGYNDATQRVLVRNSWGTSWGIKGYFTMPYKYISDTSLADDFWVITKVT